LKAAPTLPPPTDLPLPRMSFRMVDIAYDATRKQQTLLQQYAGSGSSAPVGNQYMPVPYNLTFQLVVYVRNREDGFQIIEQILPWFTPQYTLVMNIIPEMGLTKNIPIVLDSVVQELSNEGPTDSTMRTDMWTLNFTMQAFLYGPVYSGGIITQANSNLWYFSGTTESDQAVQLSLANAGFLAYQTGELVYQGGSLNQATAVGTVEQFTGNTLWVYLSADTNGMFAANSNIKGALSGASWNVIATPKIVPLATVVDTVTPANANIGQDYGFITTVYETPQTL
jgi:T4-like virus Myoviridae tail sheath stabiliser